MSLEMMAYIALAGISMLYCAVAVARYSVQLGRYAAYYSYSEFSQAISTAIMGHAGDVSVYVPAGMCNSTVSGSELRTRYGSFYFPERVSISGNLTCSIGNSDASITYANGSADVR
jgi:hypothetical protein